MRSNFPFPFCAIVRLYSFTCGSNHIERVAESGKFERRKVVGVVGGDDGEGKENSIADGSKTFARSERKTAKLPYNAFHVNSIARKLSAHATVRSTLCATYDDIDIQLGFSSSLWRYIF